MESEFELLMIQFGKLMRLGLPNRIGLVESNLESEFDCPIIVDSDSNDLMESSISNTIYNRSIFD